MPAISTGRNPGSAAGRSAGHHTAPKRKRTVLKRPTPDQADRSRSPRQKRRDKEISERNVRTATRKVVAKRTAPNRQLGLDRARVGDDKRTAKPTKPTTFAVAGPRGQTVVHTTSKPTSDAIKKLAKRAVDTKIKGLPGGEQSASQVVTNAVGGPAMQLASFIPGIPHKVAENFGKDIYQFPAQIVPSTVQTASALNELRKGNTKPIVEMAKEADKSDPVWNALLAVGNLAKGDVEAAGKRAKAAKDAAIEHPGLTALEVFGTKGALGRGFTRTGAGTARVAESRVASAVAPKTAAKVAKGARAVSSTEREARRLPGTNLVEHRQHTRDAFQRYADKKRDAQRRRRADEMRAAAEKAEDPRDALRLRENARRVDPDIIRGRGIRRAVDEHVDASEQVRRRNRGQTSKETRKELKGAQRGGPIASLLAQRITKADLPSLEKYRDRIVREGAKLDPSEKAKIAANKQLANDLTKAIANVRKGKVDLQNLKRIADNYADRSKASQQELTDRGMIDAKAAERAALTPGAVNQLGATREPKILKAESETAKAFAVAASEKAKSAKRTKTRLGGAQSVQKGNALDARVKREESMRAVDVDTSSDPGLRRTRSRGASETPTRGESVAAYIKRIEEMDPEVVKKAIKAEEKRARKMTKAEARVERTKQTAKTAKKTAQRAAKRAKDNPLVLPGGAHLSNDAIRQGIGEENAAFVSQTPGAGGAKNFYVSNEKAPNAKTGRRSGKAVKQGTFDASTERLVEQQVRDRGLADAFDSFQRMVDRFGLRNEKGDIDQADDYQAAAQIARDRSTEGQEWTAIRLNPLGADAKQLQKLMEGTEGSSTSVSKIFQNAVKPEDTKGGPWAVVPKDVADQMAKHMRVNSPNDWAKAFQQTTGVFRKTVLATSPTWFAGNIGEGLLRTALNQAGPRAYATGRRALKEAQRLDPEAAKLGEARTRGTGHFGFAERNQVHRDLSQYEDGLVKDIGRIGGAILRAEVKGVPLPPKVAKTVWDRWTHGVMNGVNKGIENQFQTAMLGKAIRNQRSGAGQRQIAHRPKLLMTDRAQQLSSKAAEDAAKGVLNENTAAALGREIDRMYGKYSKMSPAQRTFIANYTPFIAWTLNAAKFVGRLPVDHPAFTAMAAAMEKQSEEWRKSKHLAMFLPGAVPAWLMGSIPDGTGGHYRAPTRYTPFSIGVDTPGVLASAVLPQVNGVLMALRGMDWKGDPLRDENGEEISDPNKFKEAVKAFALSTVPLASTIKRVGEKGAGGVFGLKAIAQFAAPQKDKGAPAAFDDDPFSDPGASSDDGVEWEDDAAADDVDWE